MSEHPAGLGAGALAAAQQDAVRREAAHQKALDDMQVRHLPRHCPTLQHCRRDRSRVARCVCMASICR